MNKTIEILAPGKNIDSAKEAIKCGADAIFIAAEGFGLRSNLDNSLDSIEELVRFAHKYWIKIYITVNTLIFTDSDFPKVEKLIKKLYDINVDAIIIQDMGLLELDLPPIPLIAGTNTFCRTPEKVDFMEKVGFSKIVLPRELTIDQIKDISSKTNVELEAFCYGLLCVGYSGQCYLHFANEVKNTCGEKDSLYYQYNASNNGKCDQNCMHSYNLLDSDNNYIKKQERLLNLRFNDQSENLLELFDAGVTSFKIEGRHKELSYVKNVVAYFRKKADEIIKLRKIKRPSSGRSITNFEPDLSKVFNKGYTDYFLHGRKKEMYAVKDIIGESVGKAINYKNSSFELSSNIGLSIGDKLRYRDEQGNVKSIHILEIDKNRFTCALTEDNLENVDLYRYFDAEVNKKIENAQTYRVISLYIKIEESSKEYEITVTDEDGNTIKLNYLKTNEKISKDDLIKEFSKVDIDEFVVDKIDYNKKQLNIDSDDLRAKIRESMLKEREKNRPRTKGGVVKNDCKYPAEKLTYLDNVVNSKAKSFYNRHGINDIEEGFEALDNINEKQILTGKYCIKYELGLCSKEGKPNPHPEPWYIETPSNNKHKVLFDCAKCEMKLLF